MSGPTREEIRKRLFAAGRHLSAAQFGNAVRQHATPGIDWSGSPKGAVCDSIADLLLGVPPLWAKSRQRAGFTLEEVENALREWNQPTRTRRPTPTAQRVQR